MHNLTDAVMTIHLTLSGIDGGNVVSDNDIITVTGSSCTNVIDYMAPSSPIFDIFGFKNIAS